MKTLFKFLIAGSIIFSGYSIKAQTPGGVGDKAGEPTLQLWLLPDSLGLSDGNDVLSWIDYSGNSFNFSADASTSPIFKANLLNGHDYLEFSKDNNRILRNPFSMPSDALGIFMVLRTSDSGDAIVSYAVAGEDDEYLLQGSDNLNTVISGTGSASGVSYNDNNWKLFSHQWRSSDGRLLFHLNGTEQVNSTFQSGVSLTSGGSFAFGGEQDGVNTSYDLTEDFDGDIAEVIVYGSSMLQAYRVVIENYLAQKYGLDANLSVDRYIPNDATYVVSLTGMGKESDGTADASSDGLYISQNGGLDNGEYILFAHDGSSNTGADIDRSAQVTVSGATAAWNRAWYLDKTGNFDAKIAFDLSEGIDGDNPGDLANYVLLYKSAAGGNYSQVTIDSKGIQVGDQIYFTVSDANLTDGYYTLGTTDETDSPLIGVVIKSWYTLISGDWEDHEIWTLDPSGALPNNPLNEIPSSTDKVYILTGKTVTVNTNSLSGPLLSVEGRIDFQTTTGHSFTQIKGNGRILLAADEFPAGDASHFYTPGQGEGTVEYYGNSFNLNQSLEFYNLVINMTAGQTLTLLQDYTVNNYFRVEQGTFQINDNTNTSLITIDVKGDIDVLSSGSITVGNVDAYSSGAQSGYGNYHKGYHILKTSGNFTNDGIVRLTNQTAPDYNSRSMVGAASLVFYGASNKKLTCNNTTDLYYLVVDKGTDRTYELEIYADSKTDFALFGDNNGDWNNTDAANPENRKALWVANGTLRLTGYVYIPTLTEGTRDYSIGENTALVLDGANVYVACTANEATVWTGLSHGDTEPDGVDDGGSNQGLYPFGKLQIDDGHFYQGESEAINFRDEAPGMLEINGGLLEVNQIAISSGATRGDFSFILRGGEVRLTREYGGDDNYALLNLDQADMIFIMSGGSLYINNVTTHSPSGIHIASSEGNYNVSGGTVYFNSGTNVTISSTAPFDNVQINNATTLTLTQALNILNDLTIQNGATLNAAGFDVKIGDDFDFQNGATYTHGGNTTWFHERGNTANIIVGDESSLNPLVFNNVTIDKDQRYDPSLFRRVRINGGLRTSTNSAVLIEGNLLITRGDFDTEDFEVNVEGNISVEDGQITQTGGSLGRIVLSNGSAQHTLEGAFGKEQSFGHIDLDDALGVILLSDVNCTDITFTSGMFDLDTYNMTVSGSLNNYDNTRYFRTAGNSSDGGLTIEMTLSGTYGADQLVAEFPVGVTGYTPGEVYIDDYTLPSDLTGSIQVNPVNTFHPAARNSSNVLHYYWMSEETGFSSIPNDNAYYRFIYTSNVPNQYNEHVLVNNVWVDANSGINNSPVLRFQESTFGIIDGEFTAGQNGEYNNRRVLYSRQTGNWHDLNTWSEDPHGGTQNPLSGDLPESSDICIVGEGHRINVLNGAAAIDIAKLVFDHDTTVSTGIEDLPRVQVERNNTCNFYKVEGTGIFTQWIDNVNDPVISGDFGSFANEKYSWFLFVASASSVDIPTSVRVFPGVLTEGNGNRLTFTEDVIINRNLNPRGNSIISLNTGTDGDITIKGDLWLGDWLDGKLEFGSTGSERTVTIEGNIDYTQNVSVPTNYREILVLNTTPSSLEHKLYVHGNIIQGDGIMDLYNSGVSANNVILYLSGEDNGTFERTGSENSDFYRIVMNKLPGSDFDFNDSFSLNGPTDGDPKALELISGDLTLNDDNIDITLNSGGADFEIPQESSFQVNRGIVRVSGSNTGIWLDGEMTVGFGSEWFINEGTNNYIEYTTSGNSEIDINNGDLYVGSQIRRSLITDEGILNFHQDNSGSTVVVGTDATIPSNGKATFDLANTSSIFTQVDNCVLVIANAPIGGSVPALNINLDLADNPSAVSLGTGSTIQLGNADTQTGQDFGIFSNVNLVNLTLDNTSTNDPTAKIWTLPLTLTENLTIGTNTEFDANGLQLNIGGDFINNGIYSHNLNTIVFDGTADQNITGITTFYNLTKDPNVNTLILNNDITVNNDLKLNTGTLNDGDNTLHAKGDVWMDAAHIWGGTSDGIAFEGTETQVLQTENGTAAFSKMTINNPGGSDSIAVYVPEGNKITIDNELKMQRGIFDIGKNLIELDADAIINEANAFSEFNMIQTNISFTDAGIKKYYPAISSSVTFIYPIGSAGKYTPVEFTITNVDAGGYIRVKAADEIHPTIINDDEPCDNITDSLNVLKYHWLLQADGINNFTGTANMTFDPDDIQIDNSLSGTTYDVTEYIAARLLLSSTLWDKYDANAFDEDNNLMTFTFSATNDDGISGDYTAGIEDADGTCEGAIPNQVSAYVTISDGEWTDASIWDTYPTSGGVVPAGGPRGSITYVEHDVTLPSNYILNYKTTIDSGGVNNGIVRVNDTYGHRLGIVDGVGTLQTYRGTLPAGVYDDFFSASGGTLDFAGTNDNDVLSEITSINNLIFSGSGERRLPNLDLQILGDLYINGPDVINEHNEKLRIMGDITFDAGTYNTGFGTEAMIIFNGTAPQSVNGTQSFTTTTNDFNNLEIDNSSGVTLNIPVDLYDHITFTSGVIYTDDTNILTLTSTSEIIVTGAGAGRFVDGPLNKNMSTGGTFDFPIGNNGRYGNIIVNDVVSAGTYVAQYYNHNPGDDGYDPSLVKNPLKFASDNEYWRVNTDATNPNAELTLRWDGLSGIWSGDPGDIKVVKWENSTQWEVDNNVNVVGDVNSGTVRQTQNTNLNEYAIGSIYTLGSYYTPQSFTWDGSESTDWNTAGNWSGDQVPSQLDDIDIPDVANDPVISTTGNCRAINSLQTGATLTINAGANLTVYGDFTNNGTVNILSPTSSGASGSLIDNGTITGSGTFNVERYLTANVYHYVSSPIAAGGNANSDLYTTGHPSGDFNPNFYGYDETYDLDGNPSTAPAGVFDSDNLVPGWYEAHNGDGGAAVDMVVGQGYSYWDNTNKSVTYTGTVNTGTQDITGLSYTDNDNVVGPLPDYYDGWHLVGNPYPSAIDWDVIDDGISNMDNAVYVWDGTQYASYVSGVSGGSGNQNNEIAPMQAFFVHATGDNASINLNNSHRIHSTRDFLKTADKDKANQHFLRLKIKANGYEDNTVLYVKENATQGFDPVYDAYRLFSAYPDVPHIYTIIEGGNIPLSVNALDNNISEDLIIPLGVKVQTPGKYVIVLDDYDMFENINLYFEDKQEDVFIPVSDLANYEFDFEGGDVKDRFALHMRMNNAPVVKQAIEAVEVFEDVSSEFIINTNTFKEIDLGDEIVRYEAKTASGSDLPDWLSFDGSSLNFTALPGNDEVGQYYIKVSAFDKHNSEGYTEFLLTVINTNDAPFVQTTIEDQVIDAGEAYVYNLDEYTFMDVDMNDELSYSAQIIPLGTNTDVSWINFDPDINMFIGNPLNEHVGEYNVIVTATDLFDAFTSTNYTLKVNKSSFIDDQLPLEISMYPNPTVEGFKLVFTKDVDATISIHDIKGGLIYESKQVGKETYIKTNQYHAGVYIVKIRIENEIFTRQLFIR